LKLKACPPFPVRPDQFNFLLLGSFKNGASYHKKIIIIIKGGLPRYYENNLKIQDKTPNLKKHALLHELTKP